MLMPDVTSILDDPEVGGGASFQVRRKTATRVLGSVEIGEEIFDATGNIQPQEKSAQSSTAEDVRSEGIVIYSTFKFEIGKNFGETSVTQADEVIYRNKVYRVTRVEDWSEWGYTTAYATLDMG